MKPVSAMYGFFGATAGTLVYPLVVSHWLELHACTNGEVRATVSCHVRPCARSLTFKASLHEDAAAPIAAPRENKPVTLNFDLPTGWTWNEVTREATCEDCGAP